MTGDRKKPPPQPKATQPTGAAAHDSGGPVDPLLECLVHLLAHFGRARSADSIRAGLAMDGEPMGPNLFCEAAHNLGLNAAIVRRKNLRAIPAAVLPCVIVLDGGQALVLLERAADGKSAKIFVPESRAVMTVDPEKLDRSFTGFALYCHPRPEFHDPGKAGQDAVQSGWFWGLVRENAGVYGFVILASVLINILALASPLFVMNVYDRVLPNNAIETGWALGIGALAAFAFDFIFRTVRGYLIDFAGRRIDVRAARRIYDQLLNIRLSERPPSSGAFANMLRDFDAVREFVTSATITAFVDLPFTLIFLFVIAQISPGMALVLLGLMALVGTAGLLIQFGLRKAVRRSAQSAEARHGLLVETIQGLETIKTLGADGRFRVRYGTHVGDNAETARDSRFLSGLGVNIALLVQQSASVILILIGMYLVQDGNLTVGALIAAVILSGRAIAPIGQLANLMTRYHQAQGALKTLNALMDKPVERPANQNFLHRPDLRGHVVFDKVGFSYPGAPVPVLHNVSFEIKPGEKVGIIGRVGSGKSTIARLMLKLYEPQNGTIRIDGTDARQIDPADLRRAMACVAQDVVLFSGSVRDNITAGFPQASEEQVLAAAKATGVHDFVALHPMGYDAPVGEMGQYLSGGQRQAVALARAMIAGPRVLVCDEPTNAMDSQAELIFCDYVRTRMQGRTFIMITHKHSMLPLVDRLILMHQGTVIMDGPRDEVIAALQSGQIKTKGGQG